MSLDDDAFGQLTPVEQADYWLTLLESPLADDAQRQAFQAWLKSEPAHRAAWQDAQAFWRKLDRFNDDQVAEIERRLAEQTSIACGNKVVPFNKTRRIGIKLLPIAASILLVVTLHFAYMAGYFADYRSSTAQQQLVKLDDGSTVLLNTASSLSVDFSKDARDVRLKGEAYFQVAADAGRPFTVHTSGGDVRALGTAFDVKQLDDDLAVTVYEHAVRVSLKQGQVVDRLQEGQRISYRDGQLGPLETVNMRQAKAWQRHQLIFAGQPLAQVIAELNRYRSGRIVIFDKDLAAHRVTGVFDTREPEQALATIANILGLQEWRLSDALVILQRPK